jgi:outer membrane immunogenic protein
MKRFLLAVSAGLMAASMASPSFAADMPRPVYKAPMYVAPFSWTGFYVGINGGYGFGKSNWSNTFGTTGDFNTKGALAGGTIGYNLQTGAWVWGLEGDIDYSWMKGSVTNAAIGCGGAGCETRNDWLGTARGRIGYAWDRFLPYVTGGAAFGDIKATNPAGASSTKTKLGYVLGAGVEYAFLGAWSAKIEYNYVDLGKGTCAAATCGLDTDVKFKTNIVKLGVNYRF